MTGRCPGCQQHFEKVRAAAYLSCQELVELVTDYLEDRLPPAERERFEGHLALCPGCDTYVEQMRETIRLTGELTEQAIIYDWNSVEKVAPLTTKPIEFLDETLRDGIQSPSAVDPSLDDKIALLHLMDELGIEQLDVGLPGAGPHQRAAIERLCVEMRLALR